MSEHLLRVARDLVRLRRATSDASLRRSVSTAYYALFHALCELAADTLVGKKARNSEPWNRVFRSIEHSVSSRLFEMLKPNAEASLTIRQIATAFVELRREREDADYDPTPFGKSPEEVMDLIDRAGEAIASIRKLKPEEKLDLSTLLILRARPSRMDKKK